MFEFNLKSRDYKHIHFIGIGGISMSGLAEILLSKGYEVTGTDAKDSSTITRLRNLGARVFLEHDTKNIIGADLIVYTDAISQDNIELDAAKKSGIATTDRASFLGALMKNYTYSIAVSGTHGKTTTTSMLASITNHGNLQPTVLLGGQLDDIGGNVKIDSDEYILTEACEYKANILKYFPTMAIILNIDEDHLDYFKNIDHIVDTFAGYSKNLSKDDYLLANIDDPHMGKVIEATDANVITFGIEKEADYRAEDIVFSKEGYPTFNLNIKGKGKFPVTLKIMGAHNIYNAVASMAAADTYKVPLEDFLKYMNLYSGVHRRLEYKGSFKGVDVLDDYAHHPTEIKATLEAINNKSAGDVYCVFQPHTFTRTKALLESFSDSFKLADKVIITDIYAAREADTGEIHSRDLSDKISAKGVDSIYLSTFKEIEDYLNIKTKSGDVIITMGAGNVYLIGESLLKIESSDMLEKAVV
nr:UDP-N-acetylmuramate--L-alanine ligase [Tissierella sp.]